MRLWNRAIAFTIVALILLFAFGVAYGNHMAEKLGARSHWRPVHCLSDIIQYSRPNLILLAYHEMAAGGSPMDGPNSINGARGSPDTIPRNDQADAFMASIANAKANQNRGPEANQLPQARPAELRSYTPSLRERIAWGIQDGLMALGVKAYEAGHLGRGLTDIMSLTPLGIPLAANDAGRAMQRRDWGGVLVSSLGMLPAAKPLSAAERLAAANARNLGARQIEQMVPRKGQDLAAQLDATSLTAPGTLGASRVWSIKARLSAAQLPTSGRIRFVPERGYDPNVPLPRGPNRGYLDRFGNEWIKGGSRTSGQLFEWDVQLSRTGRSQLGWATRDGAHLNVSLDGKVTH